MIVDQLALGVADGAFDGMELLREIEAGAPLLEHGEHSGEMAVRALEPDDDIGMGAVYCHAGILSPWVGYRNVQIDPDISLPECFVRNGKYLPAKLFAGMALLCR
jgi:hypothetical protein